MKLLVALPQVKQVPYGSKPHFIFAEVQMRHAVINKQGKQLIVIYPALCFFSSASDSICRFVPLNKASVIAALYSANSCGTVNSSFTA